MDAHEVFDEPIDNVSCFDVDGHVSAICDDMTHHVIVENGGTDVVSDGVTSPHDVGSPRDELDAIHVEVLVSKVFEKEDVDDGEVDKINFSREVLPVDVLGFKNFLAIAFARENDTFGDALCV